MDQIRAQFYEKLKQTVSDKFARQLIYSYSISRSAAFAAQGLFLPVVDLLLSGQKKSPPKNYFQHLKDALPKIEKLLLQDAENIKNKIYPASVLSPENLIRHSLRIPSIIKDSVLASDRRRSKVHDYFDQNAQAFLQDLPEYYRRNFHFQTSGYLGEDSAELYEHQVEILFSGAADAMRRLILPEISIFLNSRNLPLDGEGLRFLELGSGTGRLTRFVSLAFPKARVTCVDLSDVYLNQAQKKLKNLKRIDYIQSAAEKLPFKDETFDLVYSCFLFHELPDYVRNEVLVESYRVLKNNGMIGAVDSIQIGDDADLQWALDQFPQDFHEPFYKNYIQKSLSDYWLDVGLKNVQSRTGFLSKVVIGLKNQTDE